MIAKRVVTRGSVSLTKAQIESLQVLQNSEGFANMKMHAYTRKKFLESQWVIEEFDDDGTPMYLLTPQGYELIETFSTGYRMLDGTCPRCKIRPKTNRRLCDVCASEYDKISRERKKRRGGLCACGNPRAKTATGNYLEKCKECQRKKTSARHKKEHERRLAMAAGGSPVKCHNAGCDNPCYISPSLQSSRPICSECAKKRAMIDNKKRKEKQIRRIIGENHESQS